MTDCERIQRLLESPGISGLPPQFQEALASHLDSCDACRRALERRTVEAVLVGTALSGIKAENGATGRHGPWWKAASQVLVFAALGALMLAMLGLRYAGTIQQWLWPVGRSSPVGPHIELRGLVDPGFEDARLGGAWVPSDSPAKDFAGIDRSVSHTGRSSLKLVQKSGAGSVSQRVSVQLPAGAEVTAAFYMLSPRGGSPDNKWPSLTLGARLAPGARDGIADDRGYGYLSNMPVFFSAPTWRPFVVRTQLTDPVDELVLTFDVGSGEGLYDEDDWVTWIDDVLLGVMVPLRNVWWRRQGQELEVRAELPSHFPVESLRRGDFTLIPSQSGRDPIPCASGEIAGGSIALRFPLADPLALRDFEAARLASPYQVRGRVQQGRFSIPVNLSLLP